MEWPAPHRTAKIQTDSKVVRRSKIKLADNKCDYAQDRIFTDMYVENRTYLNLLK